MLSFKEYIKEKWSVDSYSSKIHGKKLFAANHKNIDGNYVRIDFSGDEDSKNFTANYMVNDSYFKEKPIDPKTGHKIVSHIGKSISTFTRHMKPNSITMSSKYDRNIDLHRKITKRLAKKFNGNTEETEGVELTHNKVSFKRDIKENKDDDFEVTHEGWHGTPDARDILKNGFKTKKQQYEMSDDKPLYWAAKEHRVARTYADDSRAFDYQNSVPKTLPVQLRIKNPKHIHWEGRTFRGKDEKTGERYNIDDHIEKARDDGHDGVIIHKIKDTYDTKGPSSTIMAVFHHNNIRIKK